jgi:molybdopterin converting factor small subunit
VAARARAGASWKGGRSATRLDTFGRRARGTLAWARLYVAALLEQGGLDVDASLLLEDLAPDPRDEWARLLAFVGWSDADRRTATRSVETLLARSRELVRVTYDHMLRVPETAAMLGAGDDDVASHVEERRAFLAVWLARTLGLDTSDEFALYLFRAGQMHAGLGPRRAQVPRGYVVGTIGLVLAAFSKYLADDARPPDVIGPAMGVWSRYLSVQLDMMLGGYEAACALRSGPLAVRCTAYGRVRKLIGGREIKLGVSPESRVRDVLSSVFSAYPAIRAEALDRVWDDHRASAGASGDDGHGEQVTALYSPRPGWRLLLNGRDVRYAGGLLLPVSDGDEVAIFPPGR